MSIVNSSNYSSYSPLMVWATSDSDTFNRTHVANTSQTFEQHVHGGADRGQGLSVLNLNGAATTNTALANACDVFIASSSFTFKDSNNASHTLANLDSDETFTGNVVFSGTLKVPTSAGAAPTTSGMIAYDSTANAFKAGVNGVDQTFLTTGGGALSVTNGGTGATSLTSHAVLTGNGTSAIAAVGPGNSGTVLQGVTGSAPSFTATPTVTSLTATTVTTTNLSASNVSITGGTISGIALAAFTSVTGLSTSSGSFVDMTGFNVTKTTGAIAVVSVAGCIYGSIDGTDISLQVVVDGVTNAGGFVFNAATATNVTNCGFTLPVNVSAGSHTFKVQWETNKGTINTNQIMYLTVM